MRLKSYWRAKAAALIAIICVNTVGTAQPSPGRGDAPVFTYYVLSLTWLPSLCQVDPGADECKSPRGAAGFVLGGLWPHKDYASPVHCDVHRDLPDSLIHTMSDLLPTRRLVEREWMEHGSCTGLEPAQYFATVRQAFESVKIPEISGVGTPPQRTPFDIVKAFTQPYQGISAQTMAVTCSTDEQPKLREVRICLDQNLASRYCSGDVISSGCRTLHIQVPPL